MKFILALVLFCIFPLGTHAQTTIGGIPGKGIDINTYSGGTITEIHTLPPPTKGSTYLSDLWNIGNVYLYNMKKVEEYPLKYEIAFDMLEIKAGDAVKVIDGSRIYQFNWFDSQVSKVRTFVNARDYEIDGVPLTGFLEVIFPGRNYSLFARYTTEVIPSSYVKALDIGEKSEKIVKNIEYYLYTNGTLMAAEKSRKKLARQFKNLESKVFSYIKSNRLNCREEDELAEIVSFANDL